MTAQRARRARGSNKYVVAFNTKLTPTSKAKIDRVADAVGISQGQALDLLLEQVDVDAHGRPDGYDGPLATDDEKELPLQQSA